MKTKIIDGKTYVEIDEHKALRNRTNMNLLFLVLLFISVVLLFFAIGTVLKNKELVSQQPIDYVMDKYGFVSCSCTDELGEVFQQGVRVTEVPEVIG